MRGGVDREDELFTLGVIGMEKINDLVKKSPVFLKMAALTLPGVEELLVPCEETRRSLLALYEE